MRFDFRQRSHRLSTLHKLTLSRLDSLGILISIYNTKYGRKLNKSGDKRSRSFKRSNKNNPVLPNVQVFLM